MLCLTGILFLCACSTGQPEVTETTPAPTETPEIEMLVLTAAETPTPEPAMTATPEVTKEPVVTETPVPTETPEPGKRFYLSTERVSIHGGGSFELEAYTDSDKTESKTATWSSSDTDILIVDENGVAVGLKNGTAIVTAEANDGTGRTAECSFQVTSNRPKQKSEIHFAGNCFVGTKKLDSSETRHIRKYVEAMDLSVPGNKMVYDALHYVSYPYGTDSGMVDCSMLLLYTCLDNGMVIPRQSDKQAAFLEEKEIPMSELEPGDFIYFGYAEDVECSCSTAPVCRRYMRIHHCAVYVGETYGKKYVVEASSRVGRVCIRRWDGTEDYVGFKVKRCARIRPEMTAE